MSRDGNFGRGQKNSLIKNFELLTRGGPLA